MSNMFPNRVNMSLDEIIKLTKFEKRKQANRARRQGRGNRSQVNEGFQRGGRVARNRGRGAGVGRGVRHTVNPVKQFHTSLHRGAVRRGRGRGINRQNPGINPSNQSNINQQQNFRGRGGRRDRRGRGTQSAFTNSRVGQQQFSQQQTGQQRQRINKVRQQAALLREKKLAIQNLQQAQKNVQSINLAIQKTSRNNIVNQFRGISNVQTGQPVGQGQRKLLASLKRQGNNNQLSNGQPTRQLSNTSVTITNLSAFNRASTSGNKLRRWRKQKTNFISDHFTIQVANQNLQTVNKQSSIMDELKLLKPTVTTTYKFEKNVFATPSTAVSLNDRFSGRDFSDEIDVKPEVRKVFI